MKNAVQLSVAATVLAVGMIGSALVLSKFFVRVQQEKEIAVKGYAEAPLTSDVGKLRVRVRVRDARREGAYAQLQNQVGKIIGFIRKNAPADLSVRTTIADFDATYALDEDGDRTNVVESYSGDQDVVLTTSNVRWVSEAVEHLSGLVGEGYDVDVMSPDYYVSDLDAVKLRLLEEASADGRRRAELLARNGGAGVGALRSARQGVFQITRRNSTETSGYGVYDTSTIDKTIKAVVTLEYAVE